MPRLPKWSAVGRAHLQEIECAVAAEEEEEEVGRRVVVAGGRPTHNSKLSVHHPSLLLPLPLPLSNTFDVLTDERIDSSR